MKASTILPARDCPLVRPRWVGNLVGKVALPGSSPPPGNTDQIETEFATGKLVTAPGPEQA
jgi:hypothetical protein